MLNFWALSAIAAFGLGEVVSMNGQFRGAPPGGSVPVLDFPQIQIGDDKIRIACIALLCRLPFSFGYFIAASN